MVRFISACEVTEAQRKQALDSELYSYGDMVLVWANEGDLYWSDAVAMDELTALRTFAQRVMAGWPEAGVDGDDLQEAAVDCGLLKPLYVSFYWTWINFCWLILSGPAQQLDEPLGQQARVEARSVVPVFH